MVFSARDGNYSAGIRSRQFPPGHARGAYMVDNTMKCDAGMRSAVVIQLLRNERTPQELAIAYGLEVERILAWKKQVIDKLPTILSDTDNQ